MRFVYQVQVTINPIVEALLGATVLLILLIHMCAENSGPLLPWDWIITLELLQTSLIKLLVSFTKEDIRCLETVLIFKCCSLLVTSYSKKPCISLQILVGPDWALIFSMVLTSHRPGSSRIVVQYWQRSSKHTLPSHNISLARAGCVLRHMKEGMEWYSTLSYSLAPFLKPDLTENVGIRFVSVFLFKGNWIAQSVSVVKHP